MDFTKVRFYPGNITWRRAILGYETIGKSSVAQWESKVRFFSKEGIPLKSLYIYSEYNIARGIYEAKSYRALEDKEIYESLEEDDIACILHTPTYVASEKDHIWLTTVLYYERTKS